MIEQYGSAKLVAQVIISKLVEQREIEFFSFQERRHSYQLLYSYVYFPCHLQLWFPMGSVTMETQAAQGFLEVCVR